MDTQLKKMRKTKIVAWAICLISFLLIFICDAMMRMSWYPHQTLQGWPMVICLITCLCSFIIAINQTINYSRARKSFSSTSQPQQAQTKPKNSSANADISLLCAILPVALWLINSLLIIGTSGASSGSDSSAAGILLFIYYCTIGFPLILVWLICGILGLKSEKRNTAIVSLFIIKPSGFLIVLLLMLIFH